MARKKLKEKMETHVYWTPDEEKFLEESWGAIPRKTIAKRLDRSVNSIHGKASEMGLGVQADSSGKITLNALSEIVGINRKTLYNVWIVSNGLKSRRIGQHLLIDYKDLAKFMETHPHLYDARKCDYWYFQQYKWFLEKLERERDLGKSEKLVNRWSDTEMRKLIYLRNKGLSYSEISKEMNRSKASVSKKWITYQQKVEMLKNLNE